MDSGIFLPVALCFILAYISGKAGEKIGLPSFFGQILAGMMLSFQPIAGFFTGSMDSLRLASNLGFVSLLFMAGLEVDYKKLKALGKNAVIMGISASFVPFVLGYFLMRFMGYDDRIAIVTGLCISVTGEALTTRLIQEIGKIRTKLGVMMIGYSVANNVIGVILIALFIPVILKDPAISGYLTEFSSFGALVVSLLAGIALQILIARRGIDRRVIGDMNAVASVALIPFFFAYMGMNFELSALGKSIGISTALIITATIGKFLGVYLVRSTVGLNKKHAYLLSWCMNSRGAVELAIAGSALSYGLIDSQIFSALVLTTLITTFVFVLLLVQEARRNPGVFK